MSRLHPLENRVPPPVLGLAAAAAQWCLPRRPARAWRRVLAGGVALGSLALVAEAGHLFRSGGTTVTPLAPERASRLVTDGSYGVTRNPMYVAMAGVLLAHAVERGHPTQMLPVIGWAAYIDRFQIRPEERALQRRFGQEYAAYRQRVRRWL